MQLKSVLIYAKKKKCKNKLQKYKKIYIKSTGVL